MANEIHGRGAFSVYFTVIFSDRYWKFCVKFASIALTILGEALVIYAEVAAARSSNLAGQIEISSALPYILLIIPGGIFLVVGYMFGVIAFGSAWAIALVSIVAILVIEPPLVYLFFQTVPGRGEIIGFICGVAGILSTLLIRN